jgi:hypothetical protein
MATRFKVTAQPSGARRTLRFFFWLWALVGIAFSFFFINFFFQSPSGATIILPSVAFMAATWIGGLLFLGIGSLLCAQDYELSEP